ncbi:uncharacterized protein LOC131933222 [Physella acuta]|uniref:uncharacterized protein LOC131933222 n=1 Tax=Physella acuta TaxID=109671 RepID=UPI0027DC5DF3|nr:uncharacterized protein LOC131933222 [Physella acuta]
MNSFCRDVFLVVESLIIPYVYIAFRLVFGTLYPAYASYKAVRTKNVKEYVKWMMYWIVFALFCSVETFSDVFLSWLPFYYELKIVFVLWMLSPMTQGSSFLFKKFVHPQLARREKDIDEMIEQASKQGYSTLLTLGTKGLQAVMKTAIMGQSKLVDHLRRSYSTSDLSNDGQNLISRHEALDSQDEGEDELDNRLLEDNAELERRSRAQLLKSKSPATTLSLSSVKEEEGEDGEHVITETYSIPTTTRRHYSMKEGTTADNRKLRSQSLPPSSTPFVKKPLVIASSSVNSKRSIFENSKSKESKNQADSDSLNNQNTLQKTSQNYPEKIVENVVISTNSPAHVPNTVPSKQHLLVRSMSQDSVLGRRVPFISQKNTRSRWLARSQSHDSTHKSETPPLLAKSATLEASPLNLSTTLTVSQEIKKPEAATEQTVEGDLTAKSNSAGTQLVKLQEDLVEQIIWRSVSKFAKLPVIEEVATIDFISSSEDQKAPSSTGQVQEADDPNKNEVQVISVDDSQEECNLIFIDADEDSEQSVTPVMKDSPPRHTPYDDVKLAEDLRSLQDNQAFERHKDMLGSSFDDSDSDTSYKNTLDNKDFDSCSEWSDNSNWETFSELNSLDSAGLSQKESDVDSKLDEENEGPWSAPNSPLPMPRDPRHYDREAYAKSLPMISSQSSQRRDEFNQIMARLRREVNSPPASPREYYSVGRETPYGLDRSSPARSEGHRFDPFQTWHPQPAVRKLSYPPVNYFTLPASHPQERGGRGVFMRSSSAETGSGEAMFSGQGYLFNPLTSGITRPRSHSISSDQTQGVLYPPYLSKSHPSYYYKKK